MLAPARRFGKPVADVVGPMPYAARQTLLDEPNATHGLQRYWRSALTERISDELIDVMVAGASSFSSPQSALLFFHMHGAATRVSPTATAFAPRRAQWDFDAIGQWTNAGESATHTAWVRALWGQAGSASPGQRVREPSGRRRSAGKGARVVRGELRPPAHAEGRVRPEEPLPRQPEHRVVIADQVIEVLSRRPAATTAARSAGAGRRSRA